MNDFGAKMFAELSVAWRSGPCAAGVRVSVWLLWISGVALALWSPSRVRAEVYMGEWSVWAGNGVGSPFKSPRGVAVDISGNVYVADTGNHVIRKVTSAGVMTTHAGSVGVSGDADGALGNARFLNPRGIAVDVYGSLWVADTGNHTIRKIEAGVTTMAGCAGVEGYEDAKNRTRFRSPYGISVDSVGNILVADTGNEAVRRVGRDGMVETLWKGAAGTQLHSVVSDGASRMYLARSGLGNLGFLFGKTEATYSDFVYPAAAAMDRAGNVYVIDHHAVFKVSPYYQKTLLAGSVSVSGSQSGPGLEARFSAPSGLAVDASGTVYVADTGNHSVRKIAPDGSVSVFAGAEVRDLTASPSALRSRVSAIALDRSGNLYCADQDAHVIRKITPAGVASIVAGSLNVSGSLNGTATAARFEQPIGIAVDSGGTLYVTENYNHWVRKITPTGVVSVFAGSMTVSGTLDGTGVQARFNRPSGLAVAPSGDVFVADTENSRLRKITPAGVVTAQLPYGASNARPTGIWMDPDGTMMVTDTLNKKISWMKPSAGSSVPETGAINVYDASGNSVFRCPMAVSRHPSGLVFVLDWRAPYDPSDARIWAVKQAPFSWMRAEYYPVFSQAGTPGSTHQTPDALRLPGPMAMTADAAGNLYVADFRMDQILVGTLRGYSVPKVVSEPVSVFVEESSPLQMRVRATGGRLNYQWSKDGVPLENGTFSVLEIGQARVVDAGTYHVVVSNELGSVTSAAAQAWVAQRMPAQTVLAGSAAALGLNVFGEGASSFTFQWRREGVPIVGANESRLVLSQPRVADGGSYDLVIHSTGTLSTTVATRMEVIARQVPVISGPLLTQKLRVGVPLDLAFTVSGNEPLTCQWSKDGRILPGATASHWRIDSPVLSDAGTYTLRVSNAFGAATASVRVGTHTASELVVRVQPPPRIEMTQGLPMRVRVGVEGGGGSPLSYTLVSDGGVDLSGTVATSGEVDVSLEGLTRSGTYRLRLIGVTASGTTASVDTDPFEVVALPSSESDLLKEKTYSWSTVVGTAGGLGSSDGLGTDARFRFPDGMAVDGAGNVFVSDRNDQTIRKITPDGMARVFAGSPGAEGSRDGLGTDARFNAPSGIAIDSSGTLYVADSRNHTIRRITAGGLVTTLAGSVGFSGSADGASAVARFNTPTALFVDGVDLYVADTGNHTIRRVNAGGVSTFAGVAGVPGHVDGANRDAKFWSPRGITRRPNGDFFVADSLNFCVRRIDGWSREVSTFAGAVERILGSSGAVDGLGTAARFGLVGGIWMNADGHLWVADTSNHAIRKVMPSGMVSTFAGLKGTPGEVDGLGMSARFREPQTLAMDSRDNLYVSDSGNRKVRKIALSTAIIAGSSGVSGERDGVAAEARFNGPQGLAVNALGQVIAVDTSNHTLRRMVVGGSVSTFAGKAGFPGKTDGVGASSRLNYPQGVAVDSAGNYFVADTWNHVIRKVTSTGTVSTFAGSPGVLGSVDGTGLTARFQLPADLAVDTVGNVYVADTGNHVIRKISSSGQVSLLAGSVGQSGFLDGEGQAARFASPSGVAVDASGTVYVADTGNHVIRSVSAAGIVSIISGQPGVPGNKDGKGFGWGYVSPEYRFGYSEARFDGPSSLVVDPLGLLFVVDAGNQTIRRINSAGETSTVCTDFERPTKLAIDGNGAFLVTSKDRHTVSTRLPVVSTVAGSGGFSGSEDGLGTAARFNEPSGIAFDRNGQMYVTDTKNQTIRRISVSGEVTLLAGSVGVSRRRLSANFFDGVGSNARFNGPSGLVVDSNDNVFVTDTGTATIRKITPDGTVSTLAGWQNESGSASGIGSDARLDMPFGIALNAGGTLYVTEKRGVREIRANGAVRDIFLTSFLGGIAVVGSGTIHVVTRSEGVQQFQVGSSTMTKFSASPLVLEGGICADPSGNIFVKNWLPREIIRLSPGGQKTTVTDKITDFDLNWYPDGTPAAMVMDGSGTLFLTGLNSTIRQVSPTGAVTLIAGSWGEVGSRDGNGTEARFNRPRGIGRDSLGNLFVADTGNHTVRKITPAGWVSTVAGLAGVNTTEDTAGFDGLGGEARFDSPSGIVSDGNGTLWVADTSHHAIRRIDPLGRVTTVAGLSGAAGASDGSGYTARFRSPRGLALAPDGGLYVADRDNHTIRKIAVSGAVTTVAGSAGVGGFVDGLATEARFQQPSGLAVDAGGTLFVADTGNHTIRRILPSGEVSTVAGVAQSAGFQDGRGIQARFSSPEGIAVAPDGNVYVADTGNHAIRVVSPDGWVRSLTQADFYDPSSFSELSLSAADVAARAAAGFFTNFAAAGSADGPEAVARFFYPRAVAFDPSGALHVVDSGNHKIRVRLADPQTAPRILSQPVPGILLRGSRFRVQVVASGGWLNYRWYKDGAPIVGATTDTLSWDAVEESDTGNYSVEVSNSVGRVRSFGARVTVQSPLRVVEGPQAQAAVLGASVRWSVSVAGTGPITYQWRKNGVPLPGAVHAQWVIPRVREMDRGYYDVVVSHGWGTLTTPPAPLTVEMPPLQARPLPDLRVGFGASFFFRAVAEGSPVVGYQWFKDGQLIEGATLQTFGVDVARPVDSGSYSVVMVNAYGAVTARGSVLVGGTPAIEILQQPPAAIEMFRGSMRTARVLVDAAGVTSFQLVSAGTAQVTPEIKGTVPGDGTLEVPLRTLVSSGTFQVRLTRLYPGGATAVANTVPFQVNLRTWDGVKGVSGEQGYAWSTLAGSVGGAGARDGIGSAARLSGQRVYFAGYRDYLYGGIALDSSGNVYVSDPQNGVIRRVTASGEVSTFAGFAGSRGNVDGTGATARFQSPAGLAVDAAGNVFVVDREAYTIRKITPGGIVSTVAGKPYVFGREDGVGSAARFFGPTNLLLDEASNLLVLDGYYGDGSKVIRKVTPAGEVTTLPLAMPNSGTAFARDWRGTYYLGRVPSSSSWVDRSNAEGAFSPFVGKTNSFGNLDGVGSAAEFRGAKSMATDPSGNLFVADNENHTIRRITPEGVVTTVAGSAGIPGWIDGKGAQARFSFPGALTCDRSGNVWVVDSEGQTLRKISLSGEVTTIAGLAATPGSADGFLFEALFRAPKGIALRSNGEMYVADTGNHTIRKISPAGLVTTVAGSVSFSGTLDGVGVASRLSSPAGLAVDSAGNVYVADTGNHTIRKITTSGSLITIGGSAGYGGAVDGTRAAARFQSPQAVAVDASGNVYVADTGNHAIRKITTAGAVSTLAGVMGSAGGVDGTGSAARFSSPSGITIDGGSVLYVADSGNSMIRRISTLSQVTTLAGTSSAAGRVDATGTAARFRNPTGVLADAAGNVWVADTGNHAIRKITSAGVVTTFANVMAVQGNADGTRSTVQFSSPQALALDAAGNFFVADTGNHAIRLGAPDYQPAPVITQQPNGVLSWAGLSAAFRVGVDGKELSYQWRKSGVALAGGSYQALELGPVQTTDAGSYDVVVSNAAGSVTSRAAALTVQAGSLVSITRAPISQVVTAGGAVSWNVEVGGSAPVRYQWRKDGEFLEGATESTLTLPSVEVGHAGWYDVLVSNPFGRVTSVPVSLEVNIPPSLIPFSGPVRMGMGASFSLRAEASGTPPLAYEWSRDGVVLPGKNDPVLRVESASERDQGIYHVKITSPFGACEGSVSVAVSAVPAVRVLRESVASIQIVRGSGALYGVRINPADASTLQTTFQLLRKGATWIPAGIEGEVVPSGVVEVPLQSLSESGTYVLRFTRRYADQTTSSVDSAPFTITLRAWDEAVGVSGDQRYVWSTFAGSSSGGRLDGFATEAGFNQPSGVAVDALGNLYVADKGNHAIRKISPSRHVTTLAGSAGFSGSADGAGAAARFNQPGGLAVDGAGNVYVADTGNYTLRKITPDGLVTTLAGSAGVSAAVYGAGSATRFLQPEAVAVLASGSLYVADRGFPYDGWSRRGRMVRVSPSGATVATLQPPLAFPAAFGYGSVAADLAGRIYFAEIPSVQGNPEEIRKTSDGVSIGEFVNLAAPASTGALDTEHLLGLAVDSRGTVYVAHSRDHTLWTVSAGGERRLFGGGSNAPGNVDGPQWNARFRFPRGLAVDSGGTVYVADCENHTIRVGRRAVETFPFIESQPVTTVVSEGDEAVLEVLAGGEGLRYQWRKNGVSMDRETSGVLRLSAAEVAIPGAYDVVVTNGLGSVVSASATVTVQPRIPVVISRNPQTRTVTLGEPVVFAVQATGADPLWYQWRRNGVSLAGAVGPELRIPSVQQQHLGTYDVQVSNAFGTEISRPAVLSVRWPENEAIGTYIWSTLAGPPGGSGATDGFGADARFHAPFGIARDLSGNLFVADRWNRTIRRISLEGEVITWAGLGGAAGTVDGVAEEARFSDPLAVTVDAAGNVFVVDAMSIRKISPERVVTTLAGGPDVAGRAVDGVGAAAGFQLPGAITQDGLGNLYVADCAAVRKIVVASGAVTTMAGTPGWSGFTDGVGAAARLGLTLSGIVCDAVGNLFVTDETHGLIRKITASGQVSTVAGFGPASMQPSVVDGTGSAARFATPRGLAIDAQGNLYVSEVYAHLIRKITPAAEVTTLAGRPSQEGFTDGKAADARFYSPAGLVATSAGTLFVADWANNAIRRVTPAGEVSTVAGAAGSRYVGSVDGALRDARFDTPFALAVDASNGVFVTDASANRIRRILSNGSVTTFQPAAGSFGLSTPAGVAVDGKGAVYVADTDHHVILRVSPEGVATPFAGQEGLGGSTDGSGSAARFYWPQGLAMDSANNLFVADTGNQTIRKITPSGTVSTIAGLAGAAAHADGYGAQARFRGPTSLAVDASGTVWVAECDNHTIRKISPSGEVTTIAGKPETPGYVDGPGGLARLHTPCGLAVDAAGNVFVAEMGNSTVRKISPSGEVTTVGGVPNDPGSADGAGAVARFNTPYGLALDHRGCLLLADAGNQKIRIGVPDNSPPLLLSQPVTTEVLTGAEATLTVSAVGRGLTYQWRKQGVPLAGARASALTLNAAQLADSGSYDVVVRNAFGSVLSRPAQIRVRGVSDPAILSQLPYAVSVLPKSSVPLRVEISPLFVGGRYELLQENGLPAQPSTAGTVPASGIVDIPLGSVRRSGLYRVRFTREAGGAQGLTADSSLVRLEVRSWTEAAGTYEMLLGDEIQSKAQVETDIRGMVTVSITPSGWISGKLRYTEVRDLRDGLGNPAPGSPMAYVPVTRVFSGFFAVPDGGSLLQRASPRLSGNRDGGGQTLDLELNWGASPPTLKATVVDFVSRAATMPVRSGSSGVGRFTPARSFAESTWEQGGDPGGPAGRYPLGAGNVSSVESGAAAANVFMHVLPSLRGVWATRMPGYSGSGSSGLQMDGEAAARLPFYELGGFATQSVFAASTLSGELRFEREGESTWQAFFGSAPDAGGLRHQSSYLSRGGAQNAEPVYDTLFEQGARWSQERRMNSQALRVSRLGVLPAQNTPEWLSNVGSLIVSVQETGTDSVPPSPVTYAWGLQVSSSGALSAVPHEGSGAPPLTVRIDRLWGLWTGGYFSPGAKTRYVLRGVVPDPRTLQPWFRHGWVEPLEPEFLRARGIWSLGTGNP